MAARILEIDVGRVERCRAKRGWLLRDLAERAGLNIGTVSRALTSGRCGVRAVRAIAKALDVDVGSLVRGPVLESAAQDDPG